ncbi:MAG TPA: glycosyltransferase [Steroidobacteraceae bacterium]|nr:glycosyltransferase [Steroidobacteraceae bacterium]
MTAAPTTALPGRGWLGLAMRLFRGSWLDDRPWRTILIYSVLAALPLLIWIHLACARGGFWRAWRLQAPLPPDGSLRRRIVAVVPARNEVEGIGAAVTSLLNQRDCGSIRVVVVDDGSTDGTAETATAAAAAVGASERLTVIPGKPLAAGWTGKLWAMAQGVEVAMRHEPDYLLFTDADIQHDATNVASLVVNAERHGRDLVSYMVRLSTATLAERCLIPAFVFFFLKLYPPAWIASSRHRTAGAAGGCVLLRPRALERMGGLQSIRGEIIDDCALARHVKRSGGSIWLGLTPTTHSIRVYGTFGQIGAMISRTAFNQLRHSYRLLIGTLLGLLVTYLLPCLLMLAPVAGARWLGAAAWLVMSICYWPMVRFYRLSPAWSVCLPLIACFYAGATCNSALQHFLGRGGQWKGRVQDSRA